MPEVLTIHLGGCGNTLGPYVWRRFCEEHSVAPDGTFGDRDSQVRLQNITSFFRETETLTFRPRALMVDTDPQQVQQFKDSRFGRLFPQGNVVTAFRGVKDNWGAGFYVDGKILMRSVLEAARRETEACDSLHGFCLIHAISGGTGGGMGSLLLQELKDEYPEKMINTMSVFSTRRYQTCMMESYNALLSVQKLVDHADFTFVFDNAKLQDILLASARLEEPIYININKVLAGAISGITSFFRFPDQLNGDFRKMARGIVPYHRVQFLNTGLSPIAYADEDEGTNLRMEDMADSAFKPLNQLSRCMEQQSSFLHLSCQFRGRDMPKTADKRMLILRDDNITHFVDSLFCNLKTSYCPIAPGNLHGSAVFIGNHTGIRHTFSHITKSFYKNFQRGALLDTYKKAGVEMAHFKEADIEAKLIIREYEKIEYIGRRFLGRFPGRSTTAVRLGCAR